MQASASAPGPGSGRPNRHPDYGHHFGGPKEGDATTAFHCWGWATTSQTLRPIFEDYARLWEMSEPQCVLWFKEHMTEDIRNRMDVFHSVSPILQRRFGCDAAIAFLVAKAKMLNKRTPQQVVFNFGIGEDSGHFTQVMPRFFTPPFNMISENELVRRFDLAPSACINADMNFPIFTSIRPATNFGPCVQSWRAAGFDVISVNKADEAGALRAAGIDVVEIDGDKSKPRIGQILNVISEKKTLVAGIINADCRILPIASAEAIRKHLPRTVILSERLEVDRNCRPVPIYRSGFDAFFFDTQIIRAMAIDNEYRIGEPWWDYWFPIAAHRAGFSLKIFFSPTLLHELHPVNWNQRVWRSYAKRFRSSFPEYPFCVSPDDGEMAAACFAWLRGQTRTGIGETPTDMEFLLSHIGELSERWERNLNSVLQSWIGEIPADMESLLSRIGELSENRARLEKKLISIRQSRSWKITGPIRRIIDLIREKPRHSCNSAARQPIPSEAKD